EAVIATIEQRAGTATDAARVRVSDALVGFETRAAATAASVEGVIGGLRVSIEGMEDRAAQVADNTRARVDDVLGAFDARTATTGSALRGVIDDLQNAIAAL